MKFESNNYACLEIVYFLIYERISIFLYKKYGQVIIEKNK